MNVAAKRELIAQPVDVSALSRFRHRLPDVHARDMWVQETCLELKRFDLLRKKGVDIQPHKNSLLEMLLSIAGRALDDCTLDQGYEDYERLFGHPPTYCWTKDLSVLTIESATGSSPAVAWMRADGE
ncbi:MAG: hypothetical protein V2J51_15680 [Erythrobacter sp.]|nr:hypothetical protein [Erythrobacter sp.]